MGIFDKLKDALSGKKDGQEEVKQVVNSKTEKTSTNNEFDDLLERSRVEYKKTTNYFYSIKVNGISYYNDEVVKWDDNKKVDFIVRCCEIRTAYNNNARNKGGTGSDQDYQICSLAEGYSRHLLRTKIILTEEHVQKIYVAFIKDSPGDWMLMYNWPTLALLNLVEKQYGKKEISDSFRKTLEDLQSRLKKIAKENSYKDAAKLVAKIDGILFQSD